MNVPSLYDALFEFRACDYDQTMSRSSNVNSYSGQADRNLSLLNRILFDQIEIRTEQNTSHNALTTHRASTSMYSLTFFFRVILPERHQWKPAVQAAAVMLRTPPVNGQSPASSARTARQAFAICRHIAGWMQACNLGPRYVATATQPVHRLQVRPIVHN